MVCLLGLISLYLVCFRFCFFEMSDVDQTYHVSIGSNGQAKTWYVCQAPSHWTCRFFDLAFWNTWCRSDIPCLDRVQWWSQDMVCLLGLISLYLPCLRFCFFEMSDVDQTYHVSIGSNGEAKTVLLG